MGKYSKIRFVLFTHSYCGHFLVKRFKDKYQTNQDLVECEITKLSKVLILNRGWLRYLIFKNRLPKQCFPPRLRFYPRDQQEIQIYLKIEKEIITLTLARQDKDSLVLDDYHRALLEPAIERVAGNHLSKLKDDTEFDNRLNDLRRKYENWYYAVIYRYKLPSLRNLPFILRLISS